MQVLWVAILAAALLSGCTAQSALVRPVLEEDGELLVYLQPLPQEAELLNFSLEEIAAVTDGGEARPLRLLTQEIQGSGVRRQRFLASGILPPGQYDGLSFKVKTAFLRGEEGPSALLASEEPVTIGFPFRIHKRKAALLCLDLSYKKSVEGGFRFSPGFSIFVPPPPPIGVVGYAANTRSNNITVFDRMEREVVGVIATGMGPRGIAMGRHSRRAYVVLAEDDAVEVIDTEAGEITDRIRLHTGDEPQEPALTLDGEFLFTANAGSDTVSVIDTSSLIEVKRIPVDRGPRSILLGRDGKRAYVFNARSDTISVIDVASRSLAATITTVSAPVRGQFNRNGDRLLVIHENSPYLSVVDPITLSLRDRVYVGIGMSAIKVDTDTDLPYIGRSPDTLEILDSLSLFPLEVIPAGGRISYLTIDGKENSLYLVLPERRVLSVMNLISRELVPAIDVGEGASYVTFSGER